MDKVDITALGLHSLSMSAVVAHSTLCLTRRRATGAMTLQRCHCGQRDIEPVVGASAPVIDGTHSHCARLKRAAPRWDDPPQLRDGGTMAQLGFAHPLTGQARRVGVQLVTKYSEKMDQFSSLYGA